MMKNGLHNQLQLLIVFGGIDDLEPPGESGS
jgi:hypothetical protein